MEQGLFCVWGCSSNGRASALHAEGTGIDTLLLHFFVFLCLFECLKKNTRSILGRVVKALDLSPSGLSPRGFEPRRMQHFFLDFCLVCFVVWLHGAMVTRRIPDPKIGGSIPSGVKKKIFFCVEKNNSTATRFELARAEPSRFRIYLLNHSDTLPVTYDNRRRRVRVVKEVD